jgi:two-component system, OmpR family, sensor histidine kinase ChvG
LTIENAHETAKPLVWTGARRRARRLRRGLGRRGRALTRALSARFASSLTRRIVFLNLGGLVALAVAFLYVNQFREGLIDARVQSLQTQGEIIAAAISASASVDTDTITVDPEKLLQQAPSQAARSGEDNPSLEFSINPERVGPVLRRLVMPTRTRARIFDRDGYLLLDSRSLSSRRDSLHRAEQPAAPAAQNDEALTLIERTWNAVKGRFGHTEPPPAEEFAGRNGKNFPEVAAALDGDVQSVVRVDARGYTNISVAVPIQRVQAVKGVLLLSTLGGDIDSIIASERWAIVRIFLVAAAIMFLLSLLLAGTIAEPMRKLAEAADRVRRGTKSRQEIPDYTVRSDEIGHLSGSLRDMTKALYNRIEAIERFAADVAHELKNPLTSLRSAVETLPIAKTETSRERLLSIIQHDVKRLDRLITDISDASRLDAELARADNHDVDLVQILEAVVAVANGMSKNQVRVRLTVAPAARGDDDPTLYSVLGYDSRLGQVFNNLIDNARSFSQEGGSVRVDLRPKLGGAGPQKRGYEVVVDDDGPGIPADAFERIFERFYTDRPNQGFGQNSGLGLSISRQIVEAHGGKIVAENRTKAREAGEDAGAVLGARFTVWLPAACDAR